VQAPANTARPRSRSASVDRLDVTVGFSHQRLPEC
jgi:hypothetical protein